MKNSLLRQLMLLFLAFTMALGVNTVSYLHSADAARGPALAIGPALMAGVPQQPFLPRPVEALMSTAASSIRPGNFPFQKAQSSDNLIVVHFYSRSSSFGQQVVTLVQQDLQNVVYNTLGFKLLRAVNIYVYNSRDDFLAGADVQNPDETGAYADPLQSAIYLPITSLPSGDANDYLPHELTHIVFHQNIDSGNIQDRYFRFLPLWLDEGMAAYDEPSSSQGVSEYHSVLDDAVSRDGLINIFTDFNADYPADPYADFLGYAESRSFIQYLFQTYGANTFHKFLVDGKDGQLALAAETNFGVDLQTLRSNWQVKLGLDPIKHDAGFPLTVAAATPFVPGTLPKIATSLTPFEVAGGETFELIGLGIALVFLVLFALVIALDWLRSRAKRETQSYIMMPYLAPMRPVVPFTAIPADSPYAVAKFSDRPSTGETVTIPEIGILAPANESIEWKPAFLKVGDRLLYVLAVPLAALGGVLWWMFDPSHVWSTAFFVAGFVAAALAGIWGVRVFVAGRAGNFPLAHIAGGILVAALVFGAFATSQVAGEAQGRAYAEQGAYALASQTLDGAGVSGSVPAQIDAQWADAAIAVHDDATATQALRLSLDADSGGSNAASRRVSLTHITDDWGHALVAAHDYAQATQVYETQIASATCDATCRTTLQNGAFSAYLAWSASQIAQGTPDDAMATLQHALQRHPHASSAASVRRALATDDNSLSAALKVGAAGDADAMNLLLRLLASRHPDTDLALTATEISQPVTGVIKNSTGFADGGARLFFLGFQTEDAARTSDLSFDPDTTDIKIAATIGSDGAFATRLQPGYWYVPIWEGGHRPGKQFNMSTAPDNGAFTVSAFAPLALGTVNGY